MEHGQYTGDTTKRKQKNRLNFADDKLITTKSETLLQKSIHRLENVTPKYGRTVSTRKTETTAFGGRDLIRSK
jgi:hypothetical protein